MTHTAISSETKPSDLLALLEHSVSGDPVAEIQYKKEKVRIALSESLRTIRMMQKIDQKNLAQKMNRSQSWISKLESPNNDHTFESIAEYIFALDMNFNFNIDVNNYTLNLINSGRNAYFPIEPILPDFISIVDEKKQSQAIEQHKLKTDWKFSSSQPVTDMSRVPPDGTLDNPEKIEQWWKEGPYAA